ncbi:hypothetical protein TNCV_3748891 [Trichonephila clavipes]|nr:hypothetical protein TNCV_3748891 [Trichonephila clavipes]
MVLQPEEVGEKGFLESRSPTFHIDSSRKGHARGPVLRVPTGGRRQKRALDIQRTVPPSGGRKAEARSAAKMNPRGHPPVFRPR